MFLKNIETKDFHFLKWLIRAYLMRVIKMEVKTKHNVHIIS